MTSCRYPSLYTGRSQQQLQIDLAKAQDALVEFDRGDLGVSFSYAQGDGIKSVVRTPAVRQNIVNSIREYQAALGIIRRARRPMGFIYR